MAKIVCPLSFLEATYLRVQTMCRIGVYLNYVDKRYHQALLAKQVRDSEFEKAVHERLERAEKEKQTAVELAEANLTNRLQERAVQKDTEINRSKGKLKSREMAKELAVKEVARALEKERDDLARDLEAKKTEQKLLESSLKETHKTEIKSKGDMIAYYKDLKAKLSTKMVGETPVIGVS